MAVPAELNAELRDYQHDGLNWLNFLDSFNFGGCLADDMGLGKTIQIIAFILFAEGKTGTRHESYCRSYFPAFQLAGRDQQICTFHKSSASLWCRPSKTTAHMPDYEVVLTTYGMLLSDIQFLKKLNFNYVFLDESQVIKNPNSERYKAARLLQSRNRIVLTGTPVENSTLIFTVSFLLPVPDCWEVNSILKTFMLFLLINLSTANVP